MKGISVILCCYNSVDRLPTTLKYLLSQNVNTELNWEIILVDNNSSDNTANFATKYFENEKPSFSWRVIIEKQKGLVYARQRGAIEASYDYLIFCDDDNWFCASYIQEVYNYFENIPSNVGIIGGLGEAIFENNSLNGRGIQAAATGKQSNYDGELSDCKGVYGAGMAIKRDFFNDITNHSLKFLLTDRKGKIMSCGGDSEICLLALILGYKIHYYSSLLFFHFMPNYRLSKEHCKQAIIGVANSKYYLLVYGIILKAHRPKIILLTFPLIELFNAFRLLISRTKNYNYTNDEMKMIGLERFKNVFRNIIFYYANIKYFFKLLKLKEELMC